MARQRGNRWQADVVINGKRKRPSFKTQEEAEAFEAAVNEGYTPDVGITLGDYVDRVFDDLWGEARSRSYIEGNFRVLYRYLPRTTQLTKINEQLIEKVVADMRKDGKANGTINRKLANLSKLLKKAKKDRLIVSVPTIERRKEAEPREGTWSKTEEHNALLFFEHLGKPEIAALIKFLLYTGCRVNEALTLTRDRVREGMVTFHHEKAKNGKTRVIPLVEPAAEAWAFMSRRTNAECPFGTIPYWTFRDYWNRLRAHMGREDDKDFVPHMLRHTCATRLVQAGVDLPRVQKWMGHKSIQVTMRYAHLAPADLDVAAKALAA